MHRELAQAEAEQQARQAHVAGHFAAQRDRRLRFVAGFNDMRDQVDHRRMQRVIEMRHGVVAAVDRQRVLNQVVGADRQKIEALGEGLNDQCGGRNFNHAADLDLAVVGNELVFEFLPRLRDESQSLIDFRCTHQHRDQDAQLAVVRGAQQRAQLR